jgi:hypothetical protein
MLELLTSAMFFMSLSAAPNRDIPRNLPGEQYVYKPYGIIELEKYRGMPCPLTVPDMVTVYDQTTDFCFYVTPEQFDRLPQEDRS